LWTSLLNKLGCNFPRYFCDTLWTSLLNKLRCNFPRYFCDTLWISPLNKLRCNFPRYFCDTLWMSLLNKLRCNFPPCILLILGVGHCLGSICEIRQFSQLPTVQTGNRIHCSNSSNRVCDRNRKWKLFERKRGPEVSVKIVTMKIVWGTVIRIFYIKLTQHFRLLLNCSFISVMYKQNESSILY